MFDTKVFGVCLFEIDSEEDRSSLQSFLKRLRNNPLSIVSTDYKEGSKNINDRINKYWHSGIEVFYDSVLIIKIDNTYKNTIAIHYNKKHEYSLAKDIRITVHADKNRGSINTDKILRESISHPDWEKILDWSSLIDVDICFKLKNINLDYFIQKACYSDTKNPHVKHDLKTKRRTLYFTERYYIYETINGDTKLEVKLTGAGEVKGKLGVTKYCELINLIKSKDKELLKNLQSNIKQFENTSLFDIPEKIEVTHNKRNLSKIITNIKNRLKITRSPIVAKALRNPKEKPKYSISKNTLMNHKKRLNKDKKLFTYKIRPQLIEHKNIIGFLYQDYLIQYFLPEEVNSSNSLKIYSYLIPRLSNSKAQVLT